MPPPLLLPLLPPPPPLLLLLLLLLLPLLLLMLLLLPGLPVKSMISSSLSLSSAPSFERRFLADGGLTSSSSCPRSSSSAIRRCFTIGFSWELAHGPQVR